jgi:ATP-dependent Clp protease ATP-binding subunit ClpX
MTEQENSPASNPRLPGYCSFCRKSYLDVGPLAVSRDEVYICYHCLMICKELIETECFRNGVFPKA